MRLTPLNITLACVLVWFISEWNVEGGRSFSWGWIVLLAVILALVDLGFRLIFKNVKSLWIMQILFIIVVSIFVILLKLI